MAWNLETLTQTVDYLRTFGSDTTLIECKRAAGGTPKLGSTLCAFANMPEGGTILLGVDEHAGFEIAGVSNPAKLEKAIASQNRNSVNPAPALEFERIQLADRMVVAVAVKPLLASQKPAIHNGVAYLRQADGDYQMNSNDLRMIQIAALTDTEREQFDMQIIPGTSIEELDPQLVNTFLANVRKRSSRLQKMEDDRRLLQLINVLDREGNLRLAGLYALGIFPQGTHPSLGATAAVRLSRTSSGQRTQSLIDFEGPLPDLVSRALEWITLNTRTTQRYKVDGQMEDMPEFPPAAVREIVANAFVHRDLGPSLDAGKRVEIRVTDLALIIENPGGLRGLSVGQLSSLELAKAAVNQRLYEIAKNLHTADGSRVIEGEGGGIREVLAAMQDARLRPPQFIDTGTKFKVILFRESRFTPEDEAWLESLGVKLEPPQEDLLVALKRGETYSVSRLQKLYDTRSATYIEQLVERLVEQGVVRHEGHELILASRSTKNKSAYPPASKNAPKPQVSSNPLDGLSVNSTDIFDLLKRGGNATVKEIANDAELEIHQVRYALQPLLERSLVVMQGGQGVRRTTYHVNPDVTG